MRSHVGIVIAALAVLLTAAPGAAVMCGETITDSQTLTGDLSCPTNPGLTIDGGSLDMAGFTLTCNSTAVGVSIVGEGGSLANGVVSGCDFAGVSTTGEKHKIHHVLVSDSTIGFDILSLGTKVSDCAAMDNLADGFRASAPGTSLSRFLAKNNGEDGVDATNGGHKISDISISGTGASGGMTVTGNGNKVSKVRILHPTVGINLSGSFNKLSDITVLKHTTSGISVFGSSNKVKKAVVVGATGATEGFVMTGNELSLSGSRSTGSTTGIRLTGSTNAISKNYVFGSGTNGIWVSGASCVIAGNTVVGSGDFDLREDVAGCANNDVWKKNVGTRNDACIE